TNIQQYRPIPYSFFRIYHLLPLNIALFHLISIATVSCVGYLFYRYMHIYLLIGKAVSYAGTFAFIVSHVLFYNVYALAGMVDLIFLVFFWISILAYLKYLRSKSNRYLAISFLGFLGALFSKEIFIVIPLILTAHITFTKHR